MRFVQRMVEELEASKKEVVEAALALAERLEAVSGMCTWACSMYTLSIDSISISGWIYLWMCSI